MRSNYWSNSKLANWLRGTNKPHAGTCEEWSKWNQTAKRTHPIRFWLAEEGLDALQTLVNYPVDKLYDLKYYIVNRFVTKTHALTAHPRDIPRGTWRDVGDRFLPCLFNELVDFVEVEMAWKHVAFDSTVREKYKANWSSFGWFRTRTWRSAEAGLDYLKWELTLTNEDFYPDGHPDKYAPSHQAISAQEILELYNWWTKIRPARKDPHDESGWTEYCEKRHNGKDFFDSLIDRSTEDAQTSKEILEVLRQLEEKYEQEDEEMLIRLVRIRNSLWT